MDFAALEQTLRRAVPAVRLVKERHLKRLIAALADRDVPVAGNPHLPLWIDRRRAIDLHVLPAAVTAGDDAKLLLLIEPGDRLPHDTAERQVLMHYWRELFRGVVVDRLRTAAANRWADLDPDTRVEAEFLLASERLVPDDATAAETYAAFAAEFLTLARFAADALAYHYPSADRERVPFVFRLDVDDERLYQATRPDEMADRRPAASPRPSAEPERNGETTRGRLATARADRASLVRNHVRAAVLRTKLAISLPSGSARHRVAAREEIAGRLVPRLAAVFGWDEAERREWTAALVPVLDAAATGYWSHAAKALYDLQRVAVDLESDLYAVDPAGWVRGLGSRPLVQKLTLSRRSVLLRHLHSVRKHLSQSGLAEPVRARLDPLLGVEIRRAEYELRAAVEPTLRAVLDDVGLVPANVPEEVARDKLVAELLDVICERGHLRLADLRDAVARNRLKLPDLSGPGEFLRGDALLRADAKLADMLDGIHHRGEVYLRWIQRGSAVAFGTRVGRFLTRFVALPVAAAVMTVEFAKYLAHEVGMASRFVAGLVAPEHVEAAAHAGETAASAAHGHGPIFTPGSLTAMAVLTVVYLGLIHSPAARAVAWAGLRWVGRALRVVFVTGPVWLWHTPLVRVLRDNRIRRFVHDRFGYAVVAGMAVAGFLLAFGAGGERAGRWGGGTLLALAVLSNLPAGRRWKDRLDEFRSDAWRVIRVDLLPGLFTFLVWGFRELLGAVDRGLYTIDEWFRFREGQSKPSLVLKAALGLVWFPVAYVIRFAFYLLIEPQVNPLKHFPVVTVSHKLLLPMIPGVSQLTGLSEWTVGAVISGVPGVFGFIAWELTENWRLYAANRRARLGPLALGHHGETMKGFLRPGFHSGTVPTAFAKIRSATARAARRGVPPQVGKHLDALHHVEAAIEHFVERELVAVVRRSAAWQGVRLRAGHVSLGLQRIACTVEAPELSGGPAVLEFTRVNDDIRFAVTERGFVAGLTLGRLETWDRAVAGLAAMGAAAADGPGWDDWVRFWEGKR